MARRTTLRTPVRIALAVLGSSLGRALADGLDRAPILPKTHAAPAPSSVSPEELLERSQPNNIYVDGHPTWRTIDVDSPIPAADSPAKN